MFIGGGVETITTNYFPENPRTERTTDVRRGRTEAETRAQIARIYRNYGSEAIYGRRLNGKSVERVYNETMDALAATGRLTGETGIASIGKPPTLVRRRNRNNRT